MPKLVKVACLLRPSQGLSSLHSAKKSRHPLTALLPQWDWDKVRRLHPMLGWLGCVCVHVEPVAQASDLHCSRLVDTKQWGDCRLPTLDRPALPWGIWRQGRKDL